MMATPSYTKFEDREEGSAIPLEQFQDQARDPSRNLDPSCSSAQLQVNLEQIRPEPLMLEQVSFNANLLDPVSRQLYDNLSTKHMSHVGLHSALNQGGTQLNVTVNGHFSSLKGCQSYSEFLLGLLHRGEQVMHHNQFQFIHYSCIVMLDELHNITRLPGGIGILTDKRLLLLSTQINKTTSMNMYGDPKRLPGGYIIEECLGDTTSYLPIPLRFVKSVEISGQSGVKGTMMVNATEPPCGGLCGLCGCLKEWTSGVVNIEQQSSMMVSIGVLLPPWEKRTMLQIHTNTSVPTPVVRDFVSLLQQCAPALN